MNVTAPLTHPRAEANSPRPHETIACAADSYPSHGSYPSYGSCESCLPGSSASTHATPSTIPLQFNHPVPISALTALLDCTRSTIRHFADRLGFRFITTRMGVRHKRVACLTPEHAAAIAVEVERDAAAQRSSSEAEEGNSEAGKRASSPSSSSSSSSSPSRDKGLFYLLQLEPEFDPGRFKLGFSSDLDERLHNLLTVAPLARLIAAWPACRSWERIAIVSIAQDAEPLSQEVFRCGNLDDILAAAERFFAVMPKLDRAAPPAAGPARLAPAAPPVLTAASASPPGATQSPPAIPGREPPHPPPVPMRDATAFSAPEGPPSMSRSSQRSETSGLHPSQRPHPGAVAGNRGYAALALVRGHPA